MKYLVFALLLFLPNMASAQENATVRNGYEVCRTISLLQEADEVARLSGIDGWVDWIRPQVEEGNCVVPIEDVQVEVVPLDEPEFNRKTIVGVRSESEVWEGMWYVFQEELR